MRRVSSKITAHTQNTAKKNFKGYKGSGTSNDPFLIETMQDLYGLRNSYIGKQGYYFKQTVDIQLLKNWIDIDFFGIYRGNGYSIISGDTDNSTSTVFNNIQNSVIENIKLENLKVCKNNINSDLNNIIYELTSKKIVEEDSAKKIKLFQQQIQANIWL